MNRIIEPEHTKLWEMNKVCVMLKKKFGDLHKCDYCYTCHMKWFDLCSQSIHGIRTEYIL